MISRDTQSPGKSKPSQAAPAASSTLPGLASVYSASEGAGLFSGGIRMIDVKNEMRYILVTRLLEQAAEAGLLSAEELWAAKRE